MHHTVFIAIELHENVVPNFNITIAIFVRAAWRAARDVFTVVIEDFCTRATWACITHHPEIVRSVTSTFIVTNTNNSLSWYADFFGPNVVRLIIFCINSYPQLIRWQLINSGEQFPGITNRITLKVIAK